MGGRGVAPSLPSFSSSLSLTCKKEATHPQHAQTPFIASKAHIERGNIIATTQLAFRVYKKDKKIKKIKIKEKEKKAFRVRVKR
jgi:hypothetical protein